MTNVDELKARISYTTYEVPKAVSHAELPPLRREVVRVDVNDQVNALPKTLAALRAYVKDAKTQSHVDRHRVRTLRLSEAASRKRRWVIKDIKEWLADQHDAKIIVFSGVKDDVYELGRQLDTRLQDVKIWASTGEDNANRRAEIQDAYMSHPGPCVLVATYQAWGESLNLQDTDLCEVVLLPWTISVLIQLEGRVHRLGMTRKPLIRYSIAEETYDERIAEILLSKLPAVNAFTETDLEGFDRDLAGLDFDLEELEEIYA